MVTHVPMWYKHCILLSKREINCGLTLIFYSCTTDLGKLDYQAT